MGRLHRAAPGLARSRVGVGRVRDYCGDDCPLARRRTTSWTTTPLPVIRPARARRRPGRDALAGGGGSVPRRNYEDASPPSSPGADVEVRFLSSRHRRASRPRGIRGIQAKMVTVAFAVGGVRVTAPKKRRACYRRASAHPAVAPQRLQGSASCVWPLTDKNGIPYRARASRRWQRRTA